MTGSARVESDEAVRRQVFQMVPEVEQNHDPLMRGAAMLVDVTSVSGWINDRWALMRR